MFHKVKGIFLHITSTLIICSSLGCGTLFAQTWRELGPCGSDTYGNRVAPQGGTGQVHCIAFDPENTQIVYCGSPYGGLWKSTDGGKDWSNSAIDIHQNIELSSVNDIAISKANGKKTIWIATGHPGAKGGTDLFTTGIYFSQDDGQTFQPLESFNKKFHFQFRYKKHISRIIVHPNNPDIMFVTTSDGLYKTSNGGDSWDLVLTEEELPGSNEFSKGIYSVVFSKTDPDNVVYASGKDVYRSIKGGAKRSFKTMSYDGLDFFKEGFDCLQNVNFNINVNRDSTGRDVVYAYAYVKGDTCGEFKGRTLVLLYYYNGKNWEGINSVPSSVFADPIRIKLASVPDTPRIVYIGSVTTSVSSDYGKTWKKATDYDRPGHADIHAVEVIPGTCDMITGTDGGVFRYRYQTGKVEEYNNGLCITMVTDMGTSASNPKRILIGNQDTGADLWDGVNWAKLPTGGDGYVGQLINREDENNFFTCANSSFYENESDSGINLRNCNACLSPSNKCPYVFLQSPNQSNVFYYAERELYRSEDRCKTWCRISDFMKKPGLAVNSFGQIISCIAVAPSDSNIIYTAYNAYRDCCNSYLFKTDKGGMRCSGKCAGPTGADNWTVLSTIPRIETGDGHSNFLANGEFYISGIAISDKDPDRVWVCYTSTKLDPIDFKVYKSTDGGNSWSSDERGLPEFPCTKILYVNGSDDELFVGTYDGVYHKQGAGDWQRFGTGLPKVYISGMEINYKSRKLRASTYGRGVWETDLP